MCKSQDNNDVLKWLTPQTVQKFLPNFAVVVAEIFLVVCFCYCLFSWVVQWYYMVHKLFLDYDTLVFKKAYLFQYFLANEVR